MWLRRRQPAQITALALYAMLVLTGALALVVDAGVFFVTQRQLQTAVDAAALAAVWYSPVCTYGPRIVRLRRRQQLPSCGVAHPGTDADCVANAVLQQNLGFFGRAVSHPGARTDWPNRRCGGSDQLHHDRRLRSALLVRPRFPRVPATVHLTVFARATIGYPTPTGVTAVPNGFPLVSRLLT